ncbi:phosphoribosylaminoimidazolesuccinocarboxamide synthase [Candidatus Falkowbacteria bacterium RIFOXYC2_FULL_47_12]|uniref:Phosphoribosylaminoimidazole-succinocarboxamide synthase n=2 Tax=Candidatus Falkowiibacteriota TaxID=1752728 RepID=A0A1F5TLQ1_9BACT|nr:MAG: phosphoribosylaminoimidazolesuccinocarboxamide synthase [Candidatus Falkowbacteria bacterium RIFOXYA2_FULL_47_9]OGF39882.1 MAG: phosphoribosylaminoimidazolesuccinocarboxamide synthase [Candidatus Falkowbacteria bacterium RIFOXYC2_FULL_47_12]
MLEKTDFKNLGQRRQGKVRDIYTQADRIILVSTDRHSSFDRIIAHIPFKGQVLTQISRWWFEQTKDIVPNHIIAMPDPNVVVVKKCKVMPIEFVLRAYITGVTGTSLWTNYQKGQRDFGDFQLPDGMKKNQKLEKLVLTPTTKSDEHDRPVSGKEIVAEGMLDQATWDSVSGIALKLFQRGQEIANGKGLILVDTKYEFGQDENGNVVLIDEIHTPDSSRYWKLDTYQERFDAGQEPEYFDKEFLRLWFREHCDPYNDPQLPAAPADMVAELASRYIQIYEQITGAKFATDLDTPLVERIEKNLQQFVL